MQSEYEEQKERHVTLVKCYNYQCKHAPVKDKEPILYENSDEDSQSDGNQHEGNDSENGMDVDDAED